MYKLQMTFMMRVLTKPVRLTTDARQRHGLPPPFAAATHLLAFQERPEHAARLEDRTSLRWPCRSTACLGPSFRFDIPCQCGFFSELLRCSGAHALAKLGILSDATSKKDPSKEMDGMGKGEGKGKAKEWSRKPWTMRERGTNNSDN